MNQVVLVGRLTSEPKVKELEDGKSITNITLAVQRSYKNLEGVYETDFIDCVLWNGIAQNVCEYCQKGDVIGVKGRLQTRDIDNDDKKQKVQELIAEKITFLSSKAKDIEKEQEKDLDM